MEKKPDWGSIASMLEDAMERRVERAAKRAERRATRRSASLDDEPGKQKPSDAARR